MKTLLILVLISLSFTAQADYGEIDIIVQESLTAHFSEYGKAVDLQRMEYVDRPSLQGDILTAETSVWAEQKLIAPYWGWYDCVTKIKIKSRGRYEDLGSDCNFQFD